jgi:hypothetical protein
MYLSLKQGVTGRVLTQQTQAFLEAHCYALHFKRCTQVMRENTLRLVQDKLKGQQN